MSSTFHRDHVMVGCLAKASGTNKSGLLMFLWLDACVTVLCLSLSYVVYQSNRKINVHLSQGYVLINQVTHARLLPAKSSHSFTYSTLSYLLSLNALENSSLDLARGLVFGYGGIWGRVTGLRSAPYLADHPGSPAQTIKEKLVQLLKDRAYMRHGDVLEDAWIMTMPSFLGFEGINPLTVYYCYKPRGKFWLTVLEVPFLAVDHLSRVGHRLLPLFHC